MRSMSGYLLAGLLAAVAAGGGLTSSMSATVGGVSSFDASTTKDDGVTSVTAGTSTTYTITVANSGPGAAAGTVVDNLPAALSNASWTCVGAGGGTCTAGGTDSINDPINLPAGGSVTYSLTATVSPAAVGTVVNTASFSTVGDLEESNDSATDTDTVVQPDSDNDEVPDNEDNCPSTANNDQADSDEDGQGDVCDPCPQNENNDCDPPTADLSISKTDGVGSVSPGGSTTYTITAFNAGPNVANGATVVDTMPAALTGVTWTCVGVGGATCTAAGSGNINDTVNLPVTGSVTYTVNATVSPSATGEVSNTATVTAPEGVSDPDPANNSATDVDTVGCPTVEGSQPTAEAANGVENGIDCDSDGLPDAQEEEETGTDPQDPDTDDDGLGDGREWGLKATYTCLNLLRKDSDGEGLGDGTEVNGFKISATYTKNADNPGTRYPIGKVRTNPCKRDTDGEGLTDWREAVGSTLNQRVVRFSKDGGAYTIGLRKTHPLKRDTDGDGLNDKLEVTGAANWRYDRRKSDPTVADTDWGGNKDGSEVFRHRSDPTRVNT